MKKGQLFSYHQEINHWMKTKSVLVEFNKSRISDFYKEHQARIQKILAEILLLQKEYFVFENDDIKKDEKGQGVWAEGKTEADFNQAWTDLMEQDITTKFVPAAKMEVN